MATHPSWTHLVLGNHKQLAKKQFCHKTFSYNAEPLKNYSKMAAKLSHDWLPCQQSISK